MTIEHPNFIRSYFHGTRAQLTVGTEIVPGNPSNYGDRLANFVYVTANLNVAIWAAELAQGTGSARIFVVEALSSVEDDPNVTNHKFDGNPTRSFRSNVGFRVVAEVTDWTPHTDEEVREARAHIDAALARGVPIIEE